MTSFTKRKLNIKERETLQKVIGGANPNTSKNKKILERPHVAITLETILDQAKLTDAKLAERLGKIVNRQSTISAQGYDNITAVDANALNAIRMVWQAKGKFTDTLEIKKPLSETSDSDLDGIIKSGLIYLKQIKL